MSLRLIGERQSRILGITSTGIIIPVIMGADPDPNKPDDTDNPEGGSGDGGDGGNGDGTGDGGGGDSSTTPGKVYTEDDIQAVLRRMQAADRAKSAAELKVREFENKNKTELEKAQSDLAEVTAKAEAAEKALLETRIHNKFLASNKYNWHDPETALKLLDLADVEVKEDGSVDGLDKAIESLAKAKPFLVNGDGKKQEPKNNGGQGGGRPSGSQPPANGGGKDRDKDRARLLEKYPQLSR